MEAKTVCTHCCLLCDLYLEKGREIEGVSFRNPLCPKGILAWRITYHKRRLLYPMRRKGGYERISWERALAILSRKLKAARSKAALVSGTCSGEEISAVSSFMRAVRGKLYTSFPTLGLGGERAGLEEIERCDLIFALGEPFEQFPVLAGRVLRAKYERGVPLFNLSCRAGPTSWFSQLIQPKPGTESWVLLHLAKILIERGLYKKECEREEGFRKLKEFLAGVKEETFELSGVARSALEVPATALSRSARALILWTPGVSPEWVSNLALLVGAKILVLPGAPNATLLQAAGAGPFEGEKVDVALIFREDPRKIDASFKVLFTTFEESGADLLLPVPAFTEMSATYTDMEGRSTTVPPISDPPPKVREIPDILQRLSEKIRPGISQTKGGPSSETSSGKGFKITQPQGPPKTDERFPFAVVTQPTYFNPEWKILRPTPEFLELHPADAGKMGIKEGDRVVVKSAEGEVERVAKVRPSIPEGVLYVPDFKALVASLGVR